MACADGVGTLGRMDASTYSSADLQAALAETARLLSFPTRQPRWVKPPFWAWPLNETRTRPIPAASGWVDYIDIELGKEPGTAPEGFTLRLAAFIGTTENDPLTTGVTYRFKRNGALLPTQEFDITNTIERHLERYTNPEPYPAFARKMFLIVQNQGHLVLQVNNPSGSTQIAFAALYGYYYPNLGDVGRGGLETAAGEGGHEDAGYVG